MMNTDRLTIRPIANADLANIIPIHSDPLVNKYLPYETWENEDDAKNWYEGVQKKQQEGLAQQFIIERRDDQTLVGTCILFRHDKKARTAEFGYVLGRDYWRQGLMIEAMTAFSNYLQNDLDIKTLNAVVDTPNIKSIKLLENLGFSQGTASEEMSKENLLLFYRTAHKN